MIASQHYTFSVSGRDFDNIYGRVVERGLEHWADPTRRHPQAINSHDGGRVYFLSNDGHYPEIITPPYGTGT